MALPPSLSRTHQSPSARFWSSQLFNHTPSLLRLLEPLTRASSRNLTVLLTGETGTGKTYHARLIHEQSPRRDHQLVVVPCGAIAPRLLAGELFGHARQAAALEANQDQNGKLASAGGGTVLLDEVDALSPEEQVKLLRLLRTGEYQPVGGDTRRCQARIMASSNRNLRAAVLEGKFCEDLYGRLSEVVLHLPPLRERTPDIAPLAHGILASFCHRLGKEPPTLGPDALAALEAFQWPGNVRQLHNVIQQAVLVSDGPLILRRHLPLAVRESAAC